MKEKGKEERERWGGVEREGSTERGTEREREGEEIGREREV